MCIQYIYKGWVWGGSTTGQKYCDKGRGRGGDRVGVRGGVFSHVVMMMWWVWLLTAPVVWCFKWSWCFSLALLHHVVLQRVYLRRILLAQHLVVLVLGGERVLDVQRLVLFGWGGLHGVLQLVLGIRIILGNKGSMLVFLNVFIQFITSQCLLKCA